MINKKVLAKKYRAKDPSINISNKRRNLFQLHQTFLIEDSDVKVGKVIFLAGVPIGDSIEAK
ncbi:MAG: hypothetical protein KAQ64_01085 [Candidatus Pacebacteria bacterium]|nr:hypothetical protein [Candidatus Paceibacterota bacterium]